MLSAPINVAASGDNQIVAGQAGRVIRVANWVLYPDAAVVATWKSGSTAGGNAVALTGPMKVTTSGLYPGFVSPSPSGTAFGHFETAPGADLTLNLGAAVQASGYLNYTLATP